MLVAVESPTLPPVPARSGPLGANKGRRLGSPAPSKLSTQQLGAWLTACTVAVGASCGAPTQPGSASETGGAFGRGAAPSGTGAVAPGAGGGAFGGGGGTVGTAAGGPVTATGASSSGVPAVGGGVASGGSGAAPQQSSGGAAAGPSQDTGGSPSASSECPTEQEQKFSFFLLSREALQRESGTVDGFGGDLGGLAGADAICQSVAEYVSPCQVNKVWRAFLSTADPVVHAIDRIGQGPWYDRVGRLFANNLSELPNDRPINADPAIINDLPNESGIPNHDPDGTGDVDNHEILTGSGTDGRLYEQSAVSSDVFGGGACGDREEWTAEKATCWNWTTSEPQGCPRVGHSWPRDISGVHWISVWNEGGCAPGGVLTDDGPTAGGPDGTRRVGSAGGYGGWYCFAVTP